MCCAVLNLCVAAPCSVPGTGTWPDCEQGLLHVLHAGLPRDMFVGIRLPMRGTLEPLRTATMRSLERRRPGENASMQACCEGPHIYLLC